ncbi:MAG: hypothetical protein IAF02_08505 [Anaerolineae bacterium]|nr:hypothetical protein [Anaerolineae bacterium]
MKQAGLEQAGKPVPLSKRWTIGGICLILLIFVLHVWLYRNFFVDDAYITFRFVQQWVAGNGLVYNIGERVEGFSNLLWIVLLAPFEALGFNLVMTSKWLGFVLGLLTLFTTWRFGQRFDYPLIAPLLLVSTGAFVVWVMGGLETILFAFLIVLSCYTFVKEEERDSGWYSGILFGLLGLTRPEGLLFAGVAGLFRLWRLFQERKRPLPHDWFRLASFLLITLLFFGWRYSYYGYLLPNTVYAKSMGLHPRVFIEGAFYTYRIFLSLGGLFFVLLPIILALTDPHRDFVVSYLFANVACYLLFIFISGGDWMPLQRFAVHILPLIYLLTAAGFSRFGKLWPNIPVRFLIVLLLIGQSLFLLMMSAEQHIVVGEGRTTSLVRDNQNDLAYLLSVVDANDTIAVTDAGIYAYVLPLDVRVVDIVGLTNEHIAHLEPQFPHGLFGHGDAFGKWDVDYILAQNPKLVQVTALSSGDNGEWQTNFTGTEALINDSRFLAGYKHTEFDFFERIETE